jgi:hypothetical protein
MVPEPDTIEKMVLAVTSSPFRYAFKSAVMLLGVSVFKI